MEWDEKYHFPCPRYGENVPYSEGMVEATVERWFGLPHLDCPGCGKCCGCKERDDEQ